MKEKTKTASFNLVFIELKKAIKKAEELSDYYENHCTDPLPDAQDAFSLEGALRTTLETFSHRDSKDT